MAASCLLVRAVLGPLSVSSPCWRRSPWGVRSTWAGSGVYVPEYPGFQHQKQVAILGVAKLPASLNFSSIARTTTLGTLPKRMDWHTYTTTWSQVLHNRMVSPLSWNTCCGFGFRPAHLFWRTRKGLHREYLLKSYRSRVGKGKFVYSVEQSRLTNPSDRAIFIYRIPRPCYSRFFDCFEAFLRRHINCIVFSIGFDEEWPPLYRDGIVSEMEAPRYSGLCSVFLKQACDSVL